MGIKVGILTVSDRGYRGEYEDQSGPLIREMVTERLGATVELGPAFDSTLDLSPALGADAELGLFARP